MRDLQHITTLLASTAWYGDSFTFLICKWSSYLTRNTSTGLLRDHFYYLYVYYVRTSQGTPLWAFTACLWDIFTFSICRWFSYPTGKTPMGLHCLLRWYFYFFICRWCSYLSGNPLMSLHSLFMGYLTFSICRWCSYLTEKTPMGLHGLLRGYFYFFIYRWCS
jgi:hypothetical protein